MSNGRFPWEKWDFCSEIKRVVLISIVTIFPVFIISAIIFQLTRPASNVWEGMVILIKRVRVKKKQPLIILHDGRGEWTWSLKTCRKLWENSEKFFNFCGKS